MPPVEKIRYFATALWKRLHDVDCACPNCGSARFTIQDKKYVVTELRRCEDCYLLHRVPSDSKTDNEEFYQDRYSQGFTTELPDDAELAQLVAAGFATPEHSYSYSISVLSALGLGPGCRLFDYGCSWGYGSWQMMQAGLDVVSFEISKSRADFAREKVGVNVLSGLPDPASLGELGGTFDCFFSSHVVEHVPQPSAVIQLAKAMLRPGGYFVAITPNGSEPFRRTRPDL
jgi:2-polyprenyl-3-methyl-5-hydroxy-6-metoxy-1,4-benzoquinol methylase